MSTLENDITLGAVVAQYPHWHGWCSATKAEIIHAEITTRKLKRGLEIGVYAGKSACAAGIAMRELGDGIVIGLDPWSNNEATRFQETGENKEWWGKVPLDDIMKQAQAKRLEFGLIKHLVYHRKTSLEFFRECPADYQLDYLHIDGCHSTWNSCTDVVLWLPALRKGGILFMDDEEWPSTEHARDLIVTQCKKLQQIEVEGCLCGVYEKVAE